MDEDVAAADFLQEDTFGGVIQKARVVPGNVALAKENKA